jgi:hypothetical protein
VLDDSAFIDRGIRRNLEDLTRRGNDRLITASSESVGKYYQSYEKSPLGTSAHNLSTSSPIAA